jgi:hypothetical protein
MGWLYFTFTDKIIIFLELVFAGSMAFLTQNLQLSLLKLGSI